MRRTRVALSVLVPIFASAVLSPSARAHEGHGHAAHEHPAGKSVTIQGELIDTACYGSHPDTATGEKHRDCARTCLKKGVPMSVLTEKGDVYLLLPDHANEKVYEQAKEWAADRVEVTGQLVTRGGMKAIVVGSSKKIPSGVKP